MAKNNQTEKYAIAGFGRFWEPRTRAFRRDKSRHRGSARHAFGLNQGGSLRLTEHSMAMRMILKTAMAAAALTVAAMGPVLADDDEDCDNIMDELKKLTERIMNTNDPKAVGPVCAATGQLLGIVKASREVAAECYDEGKKRDRILVTFDRAAKEMEEKIDSVCK